MIEGEKGRKKTVINPDLKLSDILLKGIPIDVIKNRCKGKKLNYVGLYLYKMNEKDYFIRKLSAKEFDIIGKEFRSDFKWHKSYKKAHWHIIP